MIPLSFLGISQSIPTFYFAPLPDGLVPASKNMRTYSWKRDKSFQASLVDLPNTCSFLYLLGKVKEYVWESTAEEKARFEGELSKQEASAEKYSALFLLLSDAIFKETQKYMEYGCLRVGDRTIQRAYVQKWLKAWDIPYTVIEERGAKNAFVEGYYKRAQFFVWLLYGEDEALPLYNSGYRGDSYLSFACLPYEKEIVQLFLMSTEGYREQRADEEFRKRLEAAGRAKPYETLKNIPQKYISVMEGSKLNDYFGYIEVDPDILLNGTEIGYKYIDEDGSEGVDSVYNDFHALAEVFGFTKHGDVSLRFRKLGNYHASGLYWPSLKCICVDFRNPGSFAHEYFHMLDYEHEEISKSQAFREIRDEYSHLLRMELRRDKKLRERLSKGKYSLDYYLKATEIFARCGEIYLDRCCNINNALTEHLEADNFAYPSGGKLEELIAPFYDAFLGASSAEIKTTVKTAC